MQDTFGNGITQLSNSNLSSIIRCMFVEFPRVLERMRQFYVLTNNSKKAGVIKRVQFVVRNILHTQNSMLL